MNFEDFTCLSVQTFTQNNVQTMRIRFDESTKPEELVQALKQIYSMESQPGFSKRVFLDLRGLPTEVLAQGLRFSLKHINLRDPIMILNLIVLVKTYNTLQDEFFNDQHIYVTSLEQMLDLKLALSKDLKQFIKTLSVYFISLLRSYPKFVFTPMDTHIKLPELYKIMITSMDFLTLCGVFAISQPFNTDQCVYVDDALEIVNVLLSKNNIALMMMKKFSQGFEQ